MKILSCIRDFCINNYVQLAYGLEKKENCFFIGEKLSREVDNFYLLKANPKGQTLLDEIDFININEIIARDRMLKMLDKEKAISLSSSIVNQVFNTINSLKPDVIILQLVDYYIYDIICKVASKKNIQVVSFLEGFVDNTIAISKYGELGEQGNLDIDFFDYFNNKNQHQEVKKLDNIGHFKLFLRGLKSDYNRFILKTTKAKEYKNYVHDIRAKVDNYQPQPNKWVYLSYKYFNDFSLLDSIDKEKSVFVGLHFYPEAAIDYLINNTELINYEDLLELLIKENPNITFILKEHPSMFERRNPSYYKNLVSYKNVIFIRPEIRSFEVFNKVNYVMTWTGTIGIEALFSYKKVITVEETFYDIDEISKIRNVDDFKNLKKIMQSSRIPSKTSLKKLNNRLRKFYINLPHIEFANSEDVKKTASYIKDNVITTKK